MMDETSKLLEKVFDKYPSAVIEKSFGKYYIELTNGDDCIGETIIEAAKEALRHE
jgi:hypothetical protein